MPPRSTEPIPSWPPEYPPGSTPTPPGERPPDENPPGGADTPGFIPGVIEGAMLYNYVAGFNYSKAKVG